MPSRPSHTRARMSCHHQAGQGLMPGSPYAGRGGPKDRKISMRVEPVAQVHQERRHLGYQYFAGQHGPRRPTMADKIIITLRLPAASI